jgi:hypothetical protein
MPSFKSDGPAGNRPICDQHRIARNRCSRVLTIEERSHALNSQETTMNKLAFVAAPAALTMAAALGTAAAGGHPSDPYDELNLYDLSLSGTQSHEVRGHVFRSLDPESRDLLATLLAVNPAAISAVP